MDDHTALPRLLQQLRATNFRDIAGAHVTATIPVTEALINTIIATTMPANLPVREVTIRPEVGNRLSLRVIPRALLMPALTIKLDIERQPQLPDSPILVLRMATMPGLLGLAGAAFALDKALPPGVRIQGEVIHVDLRELARQRGAEEAFRYLRSVQVTTDAGRVLLAIDAAVS